MGNNTVVYGLKHQGKFLPLQQYKGLSDESRSKVVSAWVDHTVGLFSNKKLSQVRTLVSSHLAGNIDVGCALDFHDRNGSLRYMLWVVPEDDTTLEDVTGMEAGDFLTITMVYDELILMPVISVYEYPTEEALTKGRIAPATLMRFNDRHTPAYLRKIFEQ